MDATAAWLPPRPPPRYASGALLLVCGAAALAIGAAVVTAPAMLLFAAAAAVVGAAVLRWPHLGAPAALALLYSNAAVVATTVHGLPSVVVFSVPLLLAVPAMDLLLRRRQALIVPPVAMLLSLYLAVQILAGLGARDRALAVDSMVIFVTEGLLLFGLLVNVVRTTKVLRQAVWTMVLVGAVLGALSVVQVATETYADDYLGFAQNSEVKLEQLAQDHFGEHPPPRVGGPVGKKNRYAQILVVLIPMGIVLARHEPTRRLRITAAVATALVAGGVTLTFSRGAALVLVLLCLLMATMRELRLRHVLLVAVVIVAVALAFPRWGERFAGAFAAVEADGDVAQADGSARGRLSSTLGALTVYSTHALVGVGPGNYPLHHREASAEIGLRIEDTRQPHNLYAQVLAETGTLGALVLGAIVVVCLRSARRARRQTGDAQLQMLATGLWLAVVTYLATGFFLHLAYERYFWLLVALATSAGLIAARPEAGWPGLGYGVRR